MNSRTGVQCDDGHVSSQHNMHVQVTENTYADDS